MRKGGGRDRNIVRQRKNKKTGRKNTFRITEKMEGVWEWKGGERKRKNGGERQKCWERKWTECRKRKGQKERQRK